ncbi:MAG: hypothetical protein IMY86_13720 [Chloroflexi bacterium]|nr:hypothetical protein [Chloroflexota bacterium]
MVWIRLQDGSELEFNGALWKTTYEPLRMGSRSDSKYGSGTYRLTGIAIYEPGVPEATWIRLPAGIVEIRTDATAGTEAVVVGARAG